MRLLLTWLLCLLNATAIAEAPGDFAFAIPLSTGGSEALFAVELPQAVYEGVLRADLGDLRVFNAAGEPVPHAFLPRAGLSQEKQPPLPLPFFALRGDAVTGVEALEVRIERATGRAVVSMRERGRAPAGDARLLGYLLDASAIAQPVQALLVELPRGAGDLVMRVRVEASDDLARWATLVADAPLLRLAAGGQRLEQLRVAFTPRKARYFRLSWPAAAQPLALAGISAEPATTLVEPLRQWQAVDGSADKDQPGEYTVDLGGQFPLDRLRLTLPQPNSVASIEILSRARTEDRWRRVAVSTFYRLNVAGQEVVNPDLAIAVTSDRYWLLRVDPRGGGLGAGAPQLAGGWVAQHLVFAARAPAPFQLAYGSRRAVPAVYPIATLVPGYRADDVEGVDRAAAVPIGRASAGSARILAGEMATRRSVDWQRWTLWASLLLGVALLAWMALRLGRQAADRPPGAPRQGPPAG